MKFMDEVETSLGMGAAVARTKDGGLLALWGVALEQTMHEENGQAAPGSVGCAGGRAEEDVGGKSGGVIWQQW